MLTMGETIAVKLYGPISEITMFSNTQLIGQRDCESSDGLEARAFSKGRSSHNHIPLDRSPIRIHPARWFHVS